MKYYTLYPPELYHYGVLGMKWGVRRYQNYDGTLKAAGRKHLGIGPAKGTKVITNTPNLPSPSSLGGARLAAGPKGIGTAKRTESASFKEGMRSELQKHANLAKAIIEMPRNSGGKKTLNDRVFGYSTGHYLRNKLNKNLPQNEAEAKKQGWIKLSKKESEMHQFHQEDGVRNSKWISPDGHREVVYTGKGKNQHITTDPRDMGTYNFANPKKDPIGHTLLDVVPYVLVGNSSEDTTTAVQRLMDPARSLIMDTKLADVGEQWVAARTRRG